jgi:hypothetical protein
LRGTSLSSVGIGLGSRQEYDDWRQKASRIMRFSQNNRLANAGPVPTCVRRPIECKRSAGYILINTLRTMDHASTRRTTKADDGRANRSSVMFALIQAALRVAERRALARTRVSRRGATARFCPGSSIAEAPTDCQLHSSLPVDGTTCQRHVRVGRRLRRALTISRQSARRSASCLATVRNC